MSEALPWVSISIPESGYNWLRSQVSPKYRFWWGRGVNGWPVLLFELEGDHTGIFKKKRPKVTGLSVDLVSLTDGAKQGLVVSLLRPSDADIFLRLCLSIARAADGADSETQAVLSVLNHLDRWRDFLANARRRLLSSEEIRGLFAELSVIALLKSDYSVSEEDIISSWQGPLDKPQDFQFSAGLIEVKAVGGTSGSVVRISSEAQLDLSTLPIYLVSVELIEGASSAGGISLNQHVRRIEQELSVDVARTFRDRLSIAGYLELPEYDAPEFQVGRTEIYYVTDRFPRIAAADVDRGISRVRYDLDLNFARDFLVSRIAIWG